MAVMLYGSIKNNIYPRWITPSGIKDGILKMVKRFHNLKLCIYLRNMDENEKHTMRYCNRIINMLLVFSYTGIHIINSY